MKLSNRKRIALGFAGLALAATFLTVRAQEPKRPRRGRNSCT